MKFNLIITFPLLKNEYLITSTRMFFEPGVNRLMHSDTKSHRDCEKELTLSRKITNCNSVMFMFYLKRIKFKPRVRRSK